MANKLFLWALKDLCEVIEGRISNKFDNLIVIDGDRGMSKSTLAWKICVRTKMQVPFSPRRDIIYNIKDALTHLANKTNAIIWCDEMIMVTYNREFYKADNIQFIKGLNVYRDSCNLIIMCVPNFDDLDLQIRELCTLRITCVRRGLGLIQSPKKSLYTRDRWDFKGNAKIESEWINTKTKNPKYTKLSTAIGLLRFSDLTPQQRILYDSIKKEKRNRMFGSYTDASLTGDPEQLFMNKLIEKMKARTLTPEMLRIVCEVNGKNVKTVRFKLNALLKKEGLNVTTKDLINKPKRRKDVLGFVLPDTDKNKAIIIQDSLNDESQML
jgi:hypothetical protein